MTDRTSVRRGLVEALVILVSILLAFSIDAWWDERQAVGMETAMLGAVSDELARNQDELAEMVTRLEAHLDRIDRFLRASDEGLLELPQDSVALWVAALNGRASFNGDLEAISMLLQSPPLDSGKSLSLRSHLASWRNGVDEAELLGEQLDQAQIRVRLLLARYAERSGAEGAADAHVMAARLGSRGLGEMRNDEALVAAVISKADAQRLHLAFLHGLRQAAVVLTREVGERLGR